MQVLRVESRESRKVKSYRDLKVWQKGMLLLKAVYAEVSSFPKEEMYGLTSQIKRAALSVPANIAEGSSRRGTREFMRFLNIATGSLAELETHCIASQELGFLKQDACNSLLKQTDEISRMIQGLYDSLNARLSTLDSDH